MLCNNQNVGYMEERTVPGNLDKMEYVNSTIMDKLYYSVQFSISSSGLNYLFKLRSNSTNELCIFVKGDSDVMKHLKVDDILDMEYNTPELSCPGLILKTRVKNISNRAGSFKGHSIISLSIIDDN
ncbi:MAG: hypothetical protein V3T59_10250 [Desulfobacterales bacterium]